MIPHIAILPHIAIHLVNDNNRSHLVVPHIARDDVLLVKTLPEYWQLWGKSFLVSQILFPLSSAPVYQRHW